MQMALPRILVVDDDPQFRRMLHPALDSHGYQVDDAADGEAALDAVLAHPPDLILLGWRLPGMDGIETCRALRARSSAPVVMASANRSNSRDVALHAGAI